MKTNQLVLKVFLLLLLVVLFGCDPSTNTQPESKDHVILQLKWVHQTQFAGCYVAEKKGFYQENGIAISMLPGGPTVSPDKAIDNLVNGKSHFLIAGGDVFLKARKNGFPLIAVSVIFQRNPYVYIAPKTSHISRPEDLVGKTVMLPHDGLPQHRALLRQLGIPENSVKLVPYTKNLSVLETGAVDVGMVYRTGTALMNNADGMDLELIWLDDYGIKFYADTIVTSETLASQHPELITRFLKATLKGWRYAIENQVEAVGLVMQYNGSLSRSNELKMMRAQIPLIHIGNVKIGWMEQNVWEGMYRTLFPDDKNYLAATSQAVTMRFLNQAYNSE